MCGSGEKGCAICVNGDGGCLCSMNEDCFAPATKEQLLNRLTRNSYPRYRRQMWEALALTMEEEPSEERNKTMSKYIIEVEDTPFTTPLTDYSLYKIKEFNPSEYTKDAYEDGLKDAWHACHWLHNAYDNIKLKVFNTSITDHIYQTFTPMEAVKKIAEYEQSQKDEKAKEELEKLAERFGIHKIYDIVKEIRGE